MYNYSPESSLTVQVPLFIGLLRCNVHVSLPTHACIQNHDGEVVASGFKSSSIVYRGTTYNLAQVSHSTRWPRHWQWQLGRG